jgi:hypothetical protein
MPAASRACASFGRVPCLHPAEPDARALKAIFDFGPWQKPALRMIGAGGDAGPCAASGRSVGVQDFRAKKRGPLQAVPVIARAARQVTATGDVAVLERPRRGLSSSQSPAPKRPRCDARRSPPPRRPDRQAVAAARCSYHSCTARLSFPWCGTTAGTN